MKRQSLKIEHRDATRSEKYRGELLQGGGQLKVPCLRIETENGETQWMYESADITEYLQGRFV